MIIGLFHKKSKQGGLRTYIFEKKNVEIFSFISLIWEIVDKSKLYPCKFREIVLLPLETLMTKMKTYTFMHLHKVLVLN